MGHVWGRGWYGAWVGEGLWGMGGQEMGWGVVMEGAVTGHWQSRGCGGAWVN